MPKRTIKTALSTYRNEDGVTTFGFQGDEVDVHEDYVDKFDEYNVDNGDGKPVVYERVGVEVISPKTAADESDDEPAPKKSAAKKA